MVRQGRTEHTEPVASAEFIAAIPQLASPLRGWEDLDPLIDRIGDARFVLLGEATHGTGDFYEWRRVISQRLISEKDFSFIAVEGDWPDCYRVNRYAKGYADSGTDAREVLHVFGRWPTWMWANAEMIRLIEWLRKFNSDVSEQRRVGFYGLDVYSLWESMDAVLKYLEDADGSVDVARRAFECFEPYGYDAEQYARSMRWAPQSCEDEVVSLLQQLRAQAASFEQDGDEAQFNAEQNALVVKNAEKYYRTMLAGSGPSWNIRDRHMVETLNRLIDRHGPQSKAIVWAHNTHVGDARYTDMSDDGMVNIGQLVRQQQGSGNVVLVGFSTYRGKVIAAQEWGAPMRAMPAPPARRDSWEHVLHRAAGDNMLLLFDRGDLSEEFLEPRGHRAIGVVYRPALEAYCNYVPTVMPLRYDALAHVDETHALHPLRVPASFEHVVPETFPTGV